MKYRISIAHGTELEEITGPGAIDEIVIENWFHLEEMDRNLYWLRIGDARILVNTKIRQRPVVNITRGIYDEIRGATSLGETGETASDE